MKKILIVLLFLGYTGYAQIDYEGLIKNLEEVTAQTNLKTYFKDLPVDDRFDAIRYNDGRFLKYYNVAIKQLKISENFYGEREVSITPFMKKEDYAKILTNLKAAYGNPIFYDYGASKHYEWITETKKIYLKDELNNGWNKKLSGIIITFNSL
ncbi:hypothetical protein [Maribacter luteus]|uniref:hypothetical protein n=1 Tax=Maribacter luteus TaxID=2594478 RepID=UPI002493A4A7|nr:hypothetical protein [Maribacter luteus]